MALGEGAHVGLRIVHREAEELDVAGELLLQVHEAGRLDDARRAPRRPYVHDDDPAAEVGEADGPAVERDHLEGRRGAEVAEVHRRREPAVGEEGEGGEEEPVADPACALHAGPVPGRPQPAAPGREEESWRWGTAVPGQRIPWGSAQSL